MSIATSLPLQLVFDCEGRIAEIVFFFAADTDQLTLSVSRRLSRSCSVCLSCVYSVIFLSTVTTDMDPCAWSETNKLNLIELVFDFYGFVFMILLRFVTTDSHVFLVVHWLARMQALSDPCCQSTCLSVCLQTLIPNISETKRFRSSCPIGTL